MTRGLNRNRIFIFVILVVVYSEPIHKNTSCLWNINTLSNTEYKVYDFYKVYARRPAGQGGPSPSAPGPAKRAGGGWAGAPCLPAGALAGRQAGGPSPSTGKLERWL